MHICNCTLLSCKCIQIHVNYMCTVCVYVHYSVCACMFNPMSGKYTLQVIEGDRIGLWIICSTCGMILYLLLLILRFHSSARILVV